VEGKIVEKKDARQLDRDELKALAVSLLNEMSDTDIKELSAKLNS
jgi:hypothetical protein